jgi:hypothetical protein
MRPTQLTLQSNGGIDCFSSVFVAIEYMKEQKTTAKSNLMIFTSFNYNASGM